MLRITEAGDDQLRVEGRLVGPWVEVLEQACRPLRAQGERPVLEVSGVTFVDTVGTVLLRRLRAEGAELRGASAYLRSLLGSG